MDAVRLAADATALRRQRGFGLIGAVVAVAVLSLLMGTVATRMLHDMRVRQGEILGHDMARLNAAVVDFTRRYPEQIKSAATGAPPPSRQPATSQEEIAQRLLDRLVKKQQTLSPNHFRLTLRRDEDFQDLIASIAAAGIHIRPPLPDRLYVVHLDAHGGNCGSGETGTCAIDSALYIDKPVTRSAHVVDHLKLATALRHLGPGGGMSLPGNPKVITFSPAPRVHGNAAYDNPAEGMPAGILLVDNFRRVSHLPFLRIDGGHMQGDIDMGGKDIANGRSVQALKLGADVSLTVGDPDHRVTVDHKGIHAQGIIAASTVIATGDVAANGTMTGANLIARSGIESGGTIAAASDISTDSKLILGTIATEGVPCPPDGALSMDSTRKLLQCRRGYWEAVHKDPDVRVIAQEVRIIQQVEDSRTEWKKMVVNVGPRYFLQNNYSDAVIEGEWDTCEIQYVVHLQKFRLLSEPSTRHRKWWVNGQAEATQVGDSWGEAHVRCERRRPE